MTTAEPPRTNRRLVLLVAGLLALLAVLTSGLASLHARALRSRTDAHLSRGDALAAADHIDAAVRHYRAALSLERENDHAARALALALVSLRRYEEAESYLSDLLRRAPTDGLLNRGLARVEAATDRPAAARASYQRAIYGEWRDPAPEERIRTRFELIEFLTTRGTREEVVAELLRLTAELPAGQTAASKRAAEFLATEGATELAADVLRGAVATAPRDVTVLAQLADIEASLGRLAAARATLRRAVSMAPGRQDLARQLTDVERMLAIDPTLPGLGLVARTRRARTLLATIVEQTEPCGGLAAPTERVEAVQRLKRPARRDAEAAEEELHLAVRIWGASEGCRATGVDPKRLDEVVQRVARSLEPRQ